LPAEIMYTSRFGMSVRMMHRYKSTR
jgi:hypothetical protein